MLTPLSKATDLACIAGAAYISQRIVFLHNPGFSHVDTLIGVLGLTLPFITFPLTKVYQPFRNDSALVNSARILGAWFIAQLLLAILSHLYPGSSIRDIWQLWWSGIAACSLIVCRCALRTLNKMNEGAVNTR